MQEVKTKRQGLPEVSVYAIVPPGRWTRPSTAAPRHAAACAAAALPRPPAAARATLLAVLPAPLPASLPCTQASPGLLPFPSSLSLTHPPRVSLFQGCSQGHGPSGEAAARRGTSQDRATAGAAQTESRRVLTTFSPTTKVDALARRAKQGEDAFLNVYERMMRLSGEALVFSLSVSVHPSARSVAASGTRAPSAVLTAPIYIVALLRRPDAMAAVHGTGASAHAKCPGQCGQGGCDARAASQSSPIVDHVRAGFRPQELEIENTKLKETIREYREEFADVRNQGMPGRCSFARLSPFVFDCRFCGSLAPFAGPAEVTIKQLREKLQELEGSFDKAVNTKVQERERQLARQQEESERAQQNEQLALVTKQGSLEQEIKTLQKALVSGGGTLGAVREQRPVDPRMGSCFTRALVGSRFRCPLSHLLFPILGGRPEREPRVSVADGAGGPGPVRGECWPWERPQTTAGVNGASSSLCLSCRPWT